MNARKCDKVRLFGLFWLVCLGVDGALNAKDSGYRGIWYMNQPTKDEYAYKYSGGLGTYTSSHNPFAVFCPEVNKTFFCYGGAKPENSRELLHMVSYYDHQTGTVPRPTILLDKQTDDAHDNPVISVDDGGYVWIFSTSHGTSRPSYIHRSSEPYSIDRFERVEAFWQGDSGGEKPLTNFSYAQVWHVPDMGFAFFFTLYKNPAERTLFCMTSKDGVSWTNFTRLAAIGMGHYQISSASAQRLSSAFNYHPKPGGLNKRTNLYYIESPDFGTTWTTVDGKPLQLPLATVENPALVIDYESQGLLVYLMDLAYDEHGHPAILYLTSKSHQPGPAGGRRTWCVTRWNGERWETAPVTVSDNNYDMGSLYIESDGVWRIIGPTEEGAQVGNPGGEIAAWVSRDQGKTWSKTLTFTQHSEKNHTYVRRPVNAHPEFYAFWADGNAREPSGSSLFFCTQSGEVCKLPEHIDNDQHVPDKYSK